MLTQEQIDNWDAPGTPKWETPGNPERIAELTIPNLKGAIERLETDKKVLQLEIQTLKRPDHYWPCDDAESCHDKPEDALQYEDMDAVVHCLTGRGLGDVWITRKVLTVDEDGDWDETEVVTFDNRADAQKCWDESLAAARTKISS
jgi:hypothetical protein